MTELQDQLYDKKTVAFLLLWQIKAITWDKPLRIPGSSFTYILQIYLFWYQNTTKHKSLQIEKGEGTRGRRPSHRMPKDEMSENHCSLHKPRLSFALLHSSVNIDLQKTNSMWTGWAGCTPPFGSEQRSQDVQTRGALAATTVAEMSIWWRPGQLKPSLEFLTDLGKGILFSVDSLTMGTCKQRIGNGRPLLANGTNLPEIACWQELKKGELRLRETEPWKYKWSPWIQFFLKPNAIDSPLPKLVSPPLFFLNYFEVGL
jgi:hypothetical protein